MKEPAVVQLNYFAIPPSMFGTVVQGLAKAGCVRDARVIYNIYAESFRGEDHLRDILREAQGIVDAPLAEH